jgi:hypothetical protein
MKPSQTYNSDVLLTLLGSILTPRSAIYVAGPLDTGRSYYEALARNAVDGSIRTANEAALTAFVARLRERNHPVPVIDPGPLRVDGWSARDVGEFFLETISRYAKEAWFIDGWEFSSGATKEFLHCISIGIPCFAENGDQLDTDRAITLLSAAIDVITLLGLSAPKLTERLTAIRLL